MDSPTYDEVIQTINLAAAAAGEWSGCPMPVPGIPLRVEPRHPLAEKLNGFRLPGEEPEPTEPRGDDEPEVINSWYSHRMSCTVYLARDSKGYFAAKEPEYGGKKIDFWLKTIGASRAWSLDAEFRAMETLKGYISEAAFRAYVLTNSFLETSKRTKVTYLFRRGRPTVALRATNEGMRILTTLCLHPMGMYEGTWAGVMVPTDDVIAHLALMRGDEPKFWGKANHHPHWNANAGF